MRRLKPSNTTHSGIDASASAENSRGDERIHELPRARQTIASAKMMKPVQAIGVFHDQNGSICSSVIVSETIMIAAPSHIHTALALCVLCSPLRPLLVGITSRAD